MTVEIITTSGIAEKCPTKANVRHRKSPKPVANPSIPSIRLMMLGIEISHRIVITGLHQPKGIDSAVSGWVMTSMLLTKP